MEELIAQWENPAFSLTVESALLIDAVHLFYETLIDLSLSDQPILNETPLFCNSSESWDRGHTIINYMKTVRELEFNKDSLITKNFVVEIYRRFDRHYKVRQRGIKKRFCPGSS